MATIIMVVTMIIGWQTSEAETLNARPEAVLRISLTLSLMEHGREQGRRLEELVGYTFAIGFSSDCGI